LTLEKFLLLRKTGMMVNAYNPNIQEVEARGSSVQGQPGLQSETLSQKAKHTNKQKANNILKDDTVSLSDLSLVTFI
jgi:hypothetical protein